MTSTKIFNDKVRKEKQLDEITFQGRYTMNVPGNGTMMPFIEDPYVRLDKWGANFATNKIDLDSHLKNLDRKLNKDFVDLNQPSKIKIKEPNYPSESFNIKSSFISEPAWHLKEREDTYIFELGKDVELKTIPFQHNLGTRLYEKDMYCKK